MYQRVAINYTRIIYDVVIIINDVCSIPVCSQLIGSVSIIIVRTVYKPATEVSGGATVRSFHGFWKLDTSELFFLEPP